MIVESGGYVGLAFRIRYVADGRFVSCVPEYQQGLIGKVCICVGKNNMESENADLHFFFKAVDMTLASSMNLERVKL